MTLTERITTPYGDLMRAGTADEATQLALLEMCPGTSPAICGYSADTVDNLRGT